MPGELEARGKHIQWLPESGGRRCAEQLEGRAWSETLQVVQNPKLLMHAEQSASRKRLGHVRGALHIQDEGVGLN